MKSGNFRTTPIPMAMGCLTMLLFLPLLILSFPVGMLRNAVIWLTNG